ncbi:MAG: translocation/assembly module TamB domain-containing protein, partial [Rhodospirillales bacterium]
QPASLALSGSLDAGRLTLDGSLTGIDLDQASVSAELPVEISLTRLSGSLPEDGALRAAVRFAGDIARIWPLLPLPEHQMSGRFDIDASASGTIADPVLGGSARITGGAYEHLEFGSRLTAIALEARFDGGRLTLERLSAGDGASGTISADGYADLGGGNLVYRFRLAANGTRLVHRDDLEAVASADIRAEGNADGGRLAGTVIIEKAEINLAAALPPTVTTLEIENDPNRKEKDAQPASTYPLDLDLQISVPGKTFVRGRGLDSEWAGKVDIAGTASDPVITGGIRAVRGQMDVVGKVFDIRDSAINFSGGPEPRLDIAGQYKTQDLEVTAKLTGPARKPELTLTSSPPLPRDEILAQVLFGQGKANLGPLQAAQLAAAAADLSGATGGGTDVIGRIRKLAGVDVLRVEDGATGPAVAAGKYIADGVYVGAKQGSKPGSGGVEVEVEVTPNISVKSEAGQTGDSNIGIQFKWDY